jgi:hypothetical protein
VEEFHASLSKHSASHPGKTPDYQLVDGQGIPVDESNSPEVKSEREWLQKISRWAQ